MLLISMTEIFPLRNQIYTEKFRSISTGLHKAIYMQGIHIIMGISLKKSALKNHVKSEQTLIRNCGQKLWTGGFTNVYTLDYCVVTCKPFTFMLPVT